MVKAIALIASLFFVWVFLRLALGETTTDHGLLVRTLFVIYALVSLITFVTLLATKHNPLDTWGLFFSSIMGSSLGFGVSMMLNESLTWDLVIENGKLSADSKITGVWVFLFGFGVTINWVRLVIKSRHNIIWKKG